MQNQCFLWSNRSWKFLIVESHPDALSPSILNFLCKPHASHLSDQLAPPASLTFYLPSFGPIRLGDLPIDISFFIYKS
ncbi:hypothetical protein IC582_016486 [Cucumis melo]